MRKHVLSIGISNAVHVGHHGPLAVEHLHLLVNRNEATFVGLGADG